VLGPEAGQITQYAVVEAILRIPGENQMELVRVNGELQIDSTNSRMKALLSQLEREERAMMFDEIIKKDWRPDWCQPYMFRKDLGQGCYLVMNLDDAYDYEVKYAAI
jgi:hypothetical protein